MSTLIDCKLDTVVGFNAFVSLQNAAPYYGSGVIMVIANSIWHYDSKKCTQILRTLKEVNVTALSGDWMAVGERATQGQLITTYLLKLKNGSKPIPLKYQKTKVQRLALSPNRQYLVSIGSVDGQIQELIIIDTLNQVQIGTKIYYGQRYKKSNGSIVAVQFCPTIPNMFVTLFSNKVVFFILREDGIEEINARVSRVRMYTNVVFSNDNCYCCSKNGDVTQISLTEMKQKRVGPRKRVIITGIMNIQYIHPDYLLISGKGGFLALIDIKTFTIVKEVTLIEEISKITQVHQGIAYISTMKCTIYKLNVKQFEVEQFYSCHSRRINQIKFLDNYGEVFVSCSGGQIGVWQTATMRMQTRISFPSIICHSLDLPSTGAVIISGWNDDTVRVFAPKDGKLLHKISNLKVDTVTSLLSIEQSTKLIIGGSNGTIWIHHMKNQRVIACLLFHRKDIHNMKINPYNENQMISCSEDGSYGVWNLKECSLLFHAEILSYVKDCLFQNEFTVSFVGSGSKIVSCLLSDGKIFKESWLSGSNVNGFFTYKFATLNEIFLFYGGQEPFLVYYNTYQLQQENKKYRLPSFGQIVAIINIGQSIVVGTINGFLLKYDLSLMKIKDQFIKLRQK